MDNSITRLKKVTFDKAVRLGRAKDAAGNLITHFKVLGYAFRHVAYPSNVTFVVSKAQRLDWEYDPETKTNRYMLKPDHKLWNVADMTTGISLGYMGQGWSRRAMLSTFDEYALRDPTNQNPAERLRDHLACQLKLRAERLLAHDPTK